jgi:Ubiquitin elongating factor core
MKLSPKGLKTFSMETIINIIEFCLVVLRTDSSVITNPYIKAKALELIAVFVYSDNKKELVSAISSSDIIKDRLMETVIRFYVDIEFAGSSSMFYSKF